MLADISLTLLPSLRLSMGAVLQEALFDSLALLAFVAIPQWIRCHLRRGQVYLLRALPAGRIFVQRGCCLADSLGGRMSTYQSIEPLSVKRLGTTA